MQFAVDKAYCISLKERTDRQEIAKQNLSVLGNPVEFWLVEKDKENPERGCYNSHRDIACHALAQGYQRILIFEDDIVFHKQPSSRQLKRINKFLCSNQGDIFYLGVLLGRLWLTQSLSIARCRAFGSHSYILQRKGLEKLVSQKYCSKPVDQFYKQNFDCFLAFPMLTSQLSYQVVGSDIESNSQTFIPLNNEHWQWNRRYQYWSALKNIKYTLLNRPSYWKRKRQRKSDEPAVAVPE
ncbi:glycosyltransferase family 25 protein [Zooshikella harenae]|uniref:Glycosyltransferase family 25 protein n=1 Tax=Zooshikella harenae TaxID=2827238 RepID=A0ABS5ZDN5_9GAMM|nr:glycosyltransferase family 25 protein [Zooshikella harenae]MBU2711375.1 glycosyltransferase family 25 protein [Zooshikella harenae]